MLIRGDSGKILAVSRPEGGWGLPGGHVEDGETLEEGAIREVKEETGMDVCNLRELYIAPTGSDENMTTAFIADFEGTPIQGNEGTVAWVDPELLLEGPFGDFTQEAFLMAGI